MKIILLKPVARRGEPGDIIDVPPHLAEQWIRWGVAELAPEPKKKKPTKKRSTVEVETAEQIGDVETR